MCAKRKLATPVFMIVAVLVLAVAACGGKTAVTPPPASPQAQGQDEAAGLPQETDTPLPASTPMPTDTPQPTPMPTPLPVGQSRLNPYPRSTVVSVPGWEVQVVDFKRGEEAWKAIQAASQFNMAAPEGMEFLLVRLHVKSTASDGEEHRIHPCEFYVTGDSLIRHDCAMTTVSISEPKPALYAGLFTGGEAEGWAGYLINQGEKSLVLIAAGEDTYDESTHRYIALDEGASLGVSPDLAGIQPNDPGMERSNPASRSEKIITENWEISVLDVVRGEEAWAMVKNADDFNAPPAEGMEYITVKIHARNIGTVDKAVNIDTFAFRTTGSANVVYDNPLIVLGPRPRLFIALYPGGEYEGWIVMQVARGETGVTLIYRSSAETDISYPYQRYISLEP
jgi:hypothetical protein